MFPPLHVFLRSSADVEGGLLSADESEAEADKWRRLEELLLRGRLPMLFTPSVPCRTNRTSNASSPCAVLAGEPLVVMCKWLENSHQSQPRNQIAGTSNTVLLRTDVSIQRAECKNGQQHLINLIVFQVETNTKTQDRLTSMLLISFKFWFSFPG